MKITFISLFPEYFSFFKNHSIIKNGIAKNLFKIETVNPRDFASGNSKQVDDYIYGGGPGMLMMIEPIVKAIESVKTKNSITIYLSPKGKRFSQSFAKKLSKENKDLILICGHYEGIDARISNFIDYELSIGDFILTGGEIAAMAISDSIVRLLPNVINSESLKEETFENDLIETNHYTKPVDFRGYKVPDVLLSGHHKNIEKYRKEIAILNTKEFNKINKK